ncbi:hypothetical protein L6452_42813 [Arctium lappa]|uniref:Uncharacterized protein n=1 Tax=Arctium lappa TaxID=4217 RepID=A0ACB8XJA2_ARCLA|nr:hypothetical protein L6452_42813 [Arctium lappa]
METTEEGVELAAIWKKQYKKRSPRPTDVMNAIQSSTDAGLMFKLNFLVLFVNSMAECSRMGCCAVNFLHRINNIDIISSINWSGYIFECLKRSKRRWRNDTYDSFYAGPLTFLTCAIKEGGFHRALLRGPGQTSNINNENTNLHPPSPNESKEDEEEIKKRYIMELNEKFALLMRTKIDAQTLIENAKERFPLDTIFERYEDELAIFFNETTFRGSDKNNPPTTLSKHKEAGSSKEGAHEANTDIICTPTKLCFDNIDSLEALSPLSPYWYSQTTYGIIDAQIEERSGAKDPTNNDHTGKDRKTSEDEQPNSNASPTNLEIVAYDEPGEQAVPISQYGPDIPVPSFNLGISPLKQAVEKRPSKKGKDVVIEPEARAKPARRELKLGDKMKSPYMKRQVAIGKLLTTEEKKVHEWSMTAFRGPGYVH